MTSKFFTWTKGDRRNATEALQSGGVVPIPVECLKIKGMDYARSANGKNNRKPLPLPLDDRSFATPTHSSRTSDSIALHDAAVQSATSLMAVMNDMLRSPQLSAHISSQRRSDLVPPHARPRSHTAPSTPLVEAPTREPAELPGSTPFDLKKSHLSLPYGTKNSSDTLLVRPHDSINNGSSIVRPHSSPQEYQTSTFFPVSGSTESVNKSLQLHPPAVLGTPKSANPDFFPAQSHDPTSFAVDTVRAPSDANGTDSATSTQRPSLSVMQPQTSVSPIFTRSAPTSHGGSSTIVPQLGNSMVQNAQEDSDAALLDGIARLRASQDAHISSLKEAHEKELACQRSYITFLEKRRRPCTSPAPQQQQRQQLTIDTFHPGTNSELHSEPSATTLRSFESSFSDPKRTSQEAVAEVETLKRKLSLCQKAQVDAVEVRRERDHFRDTADRSERRIVQLKDIIRKAKENERALRNQTTDLEARLLEANNERTDVLEGFHDARSQVRAASERERRLAQELDELRQSLSLTLVTCATGTPDDFYQPGRAKHGRTVSDAGTLDSTPPRMDPLMRQFTESRRVLAAKDMRIKELEKAASASAERNPGDEHQQNRISDLETRLGQQKQQLTAVQSDCERYNSLLHNELRRQARHAAQRTEKSATQIEDEASSLVAEKMGRLRSQVSPNDGQQGASDTSRPADQSEDALAAALERELDHCVREIIMYKLDVKGYRKDLKKANAELDNLRAMSTQPPPTPDRDSFSSTRSPRSEKPAIASPHSTTQAPIPNDPGLGITLPKPPKTPTRPPAPSSLTIAAATSAALASPPLSSPPSRTKTPLNAHKKLPKPPPSASRTPSPNLPGSSGMCAKPKWPEQDVRRTETLRSLSESIISSYAKRGEHGEGPGVSTPGSEPLGAVSPRTPAAKGRSGVETGGVDGGFAM